MGDLSDRMSEQGSYWPAVHTQQLERRHQEIEALMDKNAALERQIAALAATALTVEGESSRNYDDLIAARAELAAKDARIAALLEDKPTAAEFEQVCTSNHQLERELAQLRHESGIKDGRIAELEGALRAVLSTCEPTPVLTYQRMEDIARQALNQKRIQEVKS